MPTRPPDPDDLLTAGRAEQLSRLREVVDRELPKLLGLAAALTRRGFVDYGVSIDAAAHAILSSPPDMLLDAVQRNVPVLRGLSAGLGETGYTTSGSIIDGAARAVADAAIACLDVTERIDERSLLKPGER